MTKAERTKGRILDAALAEFATYGVAGARVDRIASTAGCNKNLLYVYFDSKENLFRTVLESRLARLHEDIPFTPDDLPGFAGRVFDWAMAHPNLMRLVMWSTLEQPWQTSDGRTESHKAKIEVLARTSATKAEDLFSPAFLVTTIMAIATAWSPALPYGLAMHPDHPPPDLRDQVVTAIRRLTSSEYMQRDVRR